MPKNKRPVPRTSNNTREPDTNAQAQEMADLALEIAEREDLASSEPDDARREQLALAVRKAVRKKRDEVLYEAIELARFTDPLACRVLRGCIEEEAATLRVGREGSPEHDIDAFMVPLFVRSEGGLVAQQTFQDEAAFEALVASFQTGGLDSPDARVILLQHAFDLAEIDHIAYGTLHEMLREAAASLMEKKLQPAPTIAASMRGWTGEPVAPDETALELRFLLGFSFKRSDDAFYRIPKDEAGSDAYFAARMDRYRDWTVAVAPLVARCLAADPARLEVNFLYQDLFHGAKEQGVSELAMLGTLSEINGLLAAKELAADGVRAVVAPLDAGEHIELRVNLYALDGGPPWGGVVKAVDLAADLGAEVDELCDALGSIGIDDVSTADGFDDEGHPEGAQPYPPA